MVSASLYGVPDRRPGSERVHTADTDSESVYFQLRRVLRSFLFRLSLVTSRLLGCWPPKLFYLFYLNSMV
jgi:hypothetical protein